MIEVGAAVTGLKAAIQAAKAIKDVNDQAELNAAVAEIMEKLASSQSDLGALLAEHHELIEENRQLKEKLEKQQRFNKYRLEWTEGGYLIMPLRDEYVTDVEPSHVICPKCKEDGRLSPMNDDGLWYKCISCGYLACREGKTRQPRTNRFSG
ncbi:hypothetical protein [Halomonas stenophila]|uniref:Uncharacterized protein n=1 Tax=Halomonas stenophila TaxID=795312 RepID=A0A7W5EUI0_9GAMM|nr:hypothetical protein [Halomonas stenophila]MBB3231689.1 hypothetical protein [Halomonas stenophila]